MSVYIEYVIYKDNPTIKFEDIDYNTDLIHISHYEDTYLFRVGEYIVIDNKLYLVKCIRHVNYNSLIVFVSFMRDGC